MERIHVGKGVYRSTENTGLFEVFTAEQMEDRKNNVAYETLKKAKKGGGVHGVKVLAKSNKHGRVEYENADLVTREQLAIIKSVVGLIDPPEVEYEYGDFKMSTKYDLSHDSELAVDDNLSGVLSEGTNSGAIDPVTGEPYEDDDHEPFDEDFIGGDDEFGNGHEADESGTVEADGGTLGSPEFAESATEPESGGEFAGESSEESDIESEPLSS